MSDKEKVGAVTAVVRCYECGAILGIVETLHEECFFVDTKHACSKPTNRQQVPTYL